MNELDKILGGLIQRTTEGKLKWSPTVERDRFVTSIDAISVVVGQLSEARGVYPARHQLEILNDEGFTVEVLETEDEFGLVATDELATPEQAGQMNRLYVLARRSGLNAHSTLEKLAKALGAE
ncbi:MAG: hypothetical protein J4G13_12560 [Dehalococcoidia bacterium]|nr:hypothetical protein [Dehalococcoidia bacterium]